jgi:hypothetical protein
LAEEIAGGGFDTRVPKLQKALLFQHLRSLEVEAAGIESEFESGQRVAG